MDAGQLWELSGCEGRGSPLNENPVGYLIPSVHLMHTSPGTSMKHSLKWWRVDCHRPRTLCSPRTSLQDGGKTMIPNISLPRGARGCSGKTLPCAAGFVLRPQEVSSLRDKNCTPVLTDKEPLCQLRFPDAPQEDEGAQEWQKSPEPHFRKQYPGWRPYAGRSRSVAPASAPGLCAPTSQESESGQEPVMFPPGGHQWPNYPQCTLEERSLTCGLGLCNLRFSGSLAY